MMVSMKGIILNLLEQVVTEQHGAAVWDAMLLEVGLAGAYTALGNYDDAEVFALVGALAAHAGVGVPQALRGFGRAAIPMLASRYPSFFAPEDPVSFVLTLDSVIHTEVMKLYPGATPPRLSFSEVTEDAVVIRYRSARALSDLAIGFIEGTADHYGAAVTVERRPDDSAATEVTLGCRFTPA